MAYFEGYSQPALFWHALNVQSGFGPGRTLKLLQAFGSAEGAFHASAPAYQKLGITPDAASAFIAIRNSIDWEAVAAKLRSKEVYLLDNTDERFPALLNEIPQPPVLFYYRGTIGSDELALGCVGSRKITSYGRAATPFILGPIVSAGVVIVSGLAYGVDAAAHEVAVTAGKRTIAVLGSSVDDQSLYPKDHQYLASRILENGGLLLSEYPPGTPALQHHFIARNRIIAGLSLGVLVIECSEKSGSLITARHALDQNRTVYALPGPIYSEESKGTNRLLKEGAKLVTSASDILEDLRLTEEPVTTEHLPRHPAAGDILAALAGGEMHVDDITSALSHPAGDITAALVLLELSGHITALGAGRYAKVR